ncbi:metal ABC transporter substrate-binding protein [Streptomyces sp. NPDC051940]|uniref:metal ABC transporter substrate-binding protein n=1 Tax=Streptomyces sp. NPDC051940 TaxID=3155675 RepID=UPI003421B852
MNKLRRLIPLTALAGAAALTLTACGNDAAGTTSDGKLKVTASFYPMEFLAEQIGGDHVDVTTLTKPGTEPHDLELTPRQTAELAGSGFILYLKNVQPAVDEAIKQSGVENVLEASTLTTLEKTGTTEDGHDHTEDAADDGHGHDDENGLDPHIWIDPVRYAEVAEGVGAALAKADPANAADYKANAAKLTARLGDLDQKFKDGLANKKTDTFITTHAAFGYLADRYGLVQEAIKGLDPESEPSAKRVQQLHEVAEHDGVRTVFFETLVSDKTAKTLAGDLGLKTDVLDPLEGITDQSKGDDYFAVQEANLQALQKALGATA